MKVWPGALGLIVTGASVLLAVGCKTNQADPSISVEGDKEATSPAAETRAPEEKDVEADGGPGDHGDKKAGDHSPKKRVFQAFEVNPDEPCDHCIDRFCKRLNGVDYVARCFDGEDGDVCRAVVACADRTKCAKRLSADCFCGEGVTISECMGKGGQGPCKEEVERAAKTKDPSEIAVRFADPKYPVGRAMAVVDCKRSYCKKCYE